MSESIMIMLGVLIAFIGGLGVSMISMKGIFFPWMKAKTSGGILLMEISESGDSARFSCLKPKKGREGVYFYKGMDGKEHVVTPVGVIRLLKVRFLMVNQRDSSPLIPKKVTERISKDGVEYRKFLPYNDTREMTNMLIRALVRPKSKEDMGTMMKTMLLPLLAGAAVGFIIATQFMGA